MSVNVKVMMMAFNHHKKYVYWEQTYLFQFNDKKTATKFCDLCNLFLKWHNIKKGGDNDDIG